MARGAKRYWNQKKEIRFPSNTFLRAPVTAEIGGEITKKKNMKRCNDTQCMRGLCAVCPPRMRTDIFTHVYNTDIHIVYIYVYIGVCGYTLCLMIDILSG